MYVSSWQAEILPVKTGAGWQLELSNIGQIFTMLQEGQAKNTSGLDYNDYLQILLFASSGHSLAFRCMDMIEQNIRLKPGKENFRIDSCMECSGDGNPFFKPIRKPMDSSQKLRIRYVKSRKGRGADARCKRQTKM